MIHLKKLRSIGLTTLLMLAGCSLPINAGCPPDRYGNIIDLGNGQCQQLQGNPTSSSPRESSTVPQSSTSQSPGVESTGSQTSAQTFLWKAESAHNVVYLLGSVHFLAAENYPLPRSMQVAFDDAEGVVFEIDLNEQKTLEAQQMILEKAQPESGETLRASLSPKVYALATQKAAELGLPIEMFQNLEPWFFTLMILPLEFQKIGFEPQYGVDYHFYNQAVAQNKEILGLETLEYQISLFDRLSTADQQNLVLQTLEDLKSTETLLTELVSSWLTGNVPQFTQLALESFQSYPQLQQAFLTDRNLNWLKTIEPLFTQNKDYLVIVGAAHLVGDQGLIQLLNDRGYQFEQVSSPPN
jgi:uncharacterized protein YbaP (TraB family)